MNDAALVDQAFKRDRRFMVGGLSAITLMAWGHLVHMAWSMGNIDMTMSMGAVQAWTAWDAVMLFVMWAIMMVAMMVPSVSPMVLMFVTTNRRLREQQAPYVPTSFFLLGYLALWTVFSIAATLAQWALHSAALLSPMMVSSSAILNGILLICAGLFQWTPLKHACLRHCRSPIGFLMTRWREGTWGAFRMGLEHGAYCTGCCWALMCLLFVTGVMNLLWVAIIAAYVLGEKIIPRGERVGRIMGVSLVGYGIWLVAVAFSS